MKYKGKNVLRGYCKRFGVNWTCAAIELQGIGVELDPEYLKKREQSDRALAAHRRRRREAGKKKVASSPCRLKEREYGSLLEAYLEEDYVALYAMECRRDGSRYS